MKICVDIGMTVILLLLMSYELIGQTTHEWLGTGMFLLFLIHHILNRKWSRSLLKNYTLVKIWQVLLVVFVLFCMLGSMISGIILSRNVFSFLPINGGRSFSRSLHMICAYWGLIGMSLHLGFHWNIMIAMIRRACPKASVIRTYILRILAGIIAGYGSYAFVKRKIASYMFLKTPFVFLDYGEPLFFFFLDYISIMGLFVFIGHYFAEALKMSNRKRKECKKM